MHNAHASARILLARTPLDPALRSSLRRAKSTNTKTAPDAPRQTHFPGIQVPAQPTELSEDGARSLRAREHGFRSLPLPTFMDPKKVERRNEYRTPKLDALPEGSQEALDFSKELALNPFAQALATPIRQCIATNARLPQHFLLKFTLLPPKDGSVDPEKPETDKAPPTATRFGFSGPEINNQQLASYLIANKSVLPVVNEKGAWQVLLNERLRDRLALLHNRSTRSKGAFKQVEWDYDTPALILQSLKNHLAKSLRRCGSFRLGKERRGERLVIPLKADTASESKDTGKLVALLSLRASDEHVYKGVLVRDLSRFFEPAELAELAENVGCGDADAIGLLEHWQTTKLLIAVERMRLLMPP